MNIPVSFSQKRSRTIRSKTTYIILIRSELIIERTRLSNAFPMFLEIPFFWQVSDSRITKPSCFVLLVFLIIQFQSSTQINRESPCTFIVLCTKIYEPSTHIDNNSSDSAVICQSQQPSTTAKDLTKHMYVVLNQLNWCDGNNPIDDVHIKSIFL